MYLSLHISSCMFDNTATIWFILYKFIFILPKIYKTYNLHLFLMLLIVTNQHIIKNENLVLFLINMDHNKQ